MLGHEDKSAREKVRFRCFVLTNSLRQISAHSFLGDRLFRHYCSPKECRAMRERLEQLKNADLGTTKPLKDQLMDYELQANNRGGSTTEELISCTSCEEEPNDPVEGKVRTVVSQWHVASADRFIIS